MVVVGRSRPRQPNEWGSVRTHLTMAKHRKYWTGLITLGDEPFQPKPPFTGAGWRATLAPQRRDPPSVYRGREVVLHAKSWASAQRALELIQGCHQLLFAEPPVFPVHPIAHNSTEPQWMEEQQRQAQVEKTSTTSDFPLACAVAARSSRRRKWVYAVAKYKFSLSLYAVHHVDLEPFRSPHLRLSSFPGDHVMFSHAIISAYSVVEDLGLQVRASSSKPSRIRGEWNPVVKQDLEHRLSDSGVGIGETIVWTVRGPKRKTEMKRAVPVAARALWSGWNVHDAELHITDAIAYAAWLRDCVASHGVKDLTRALSPYDVVNVQHLARRLLLESLGFWGWQEKETAQTRAPIVPGKAIGRT